MCSIFLILLVLMVRPYTSHSIDEALNRTKESVPEGIQNKMDTYETYYPLLIMLFALPENETESLEKYLNQRTYAELKRMIDEKRKENAMEFTSFYEELEKNSTDLLSLIQLENNKKYINLVEAYHNASIYSAIRGVYNSKINPILPPIDQLAILEYFAERKVSELIQMSFWSRLWHALENWITGKQGKEEGCFADEPICIRRVVETLPMERRMELDNAIENNEGIIVNEIINSQLGELSLTAREEFENWKNINSPPQALFNLMETMTEDEKVALDRLRENDHIHSIKDYYRALIETRTHSEQEELRHFFQRINDTYARCYNPIRCKYEFYR